MITIKKVKQIPFLGFEALKKASLNEGFRFVDRLEQEWIQGNNRFSKKGEALYKVLYINCFAGIGGITHCPYQNKEGTGRLRRCYITTQMRRLGVGRQLVTYILDEARLEFKEIVLFTDNPDAAVFYEKLGFTPIANRFKVSHRWVGPTEQI